MKNMVCSQNIEKINASEKNVIQYLHFQICLCNLYCINHGKSEQCHMIFICWLQLIWPPCNNCYKWQLFHLDKNTWIFFSFKSTIITAQTDSSVILSLTVAKTHKQIEQTGFDCKTATKSISEWFEKTNECVPEREAVSPLRPAGRSLDSYNRLQPEWAPCRGRGWLRPPKLGFRFLI